MNFFLISCNFIPVGFVAFNLLTAPLSLFVELHRGDMQEKDSLQEVSLAASPQFFLTFKRWCRFFFFFFFF